jgi:vacuolar protein sorting-associated protein 13A/C
MLEGVLANFLNRTIGQYVENLEYSQLNVGVWKGDVVLKDLRLRKDALDRFELPIDVLEGYLGELTLKVPWSDLGRSPVRIYINNLFLLATPKAESSFDAKAEEERLQKSKMNKLETLQMLSGDKVESGTLSHF